MKRLIMLLLIVLLTVPVLAQDEAPDIETAISVRDLNEDIYPINPTLSPDGTMLASFGPNGLCIYTFADSQHHCLEGSDEMRIRTLTMAWSSDSKYIALTEDMFIRAYESDLWVYDVEADTLTNLTDDGLEGTFFRMDEDDGTPLLDTSPIWRPGTHEIFFWRYIRNEDGYDQALYRITPEGGEPELIRDLTNVAPILSIYQIDRYNLQGYADFSPDGTKLAFLVRAREMDNTLNGIWMIDLADDNRLSPLMPTTALLTGVMDNALEFGVPPTPDGIAWSLDGSGMYITASYQALDATFTPPYYLDIETRTVTSLTDFSGKTQREFFTETDIFGHSLVYQAARTAVVLPGVDGFVALNWDNFQSGDAALIRWTKDGMQQVVYFFDELGGPGGPGNTQVSVSADGKMLMFGYLFLP